MRNFALSLLSVIALVGCDASNNTNPGATDGSGTDIVDTTDGNTPANFEAWANMSADKSLNPTFVINQSPVAAEFCNVDDGSCEYPLSDAGGTIYTATVEIDGYTAVQQTWKVENDDDGKTFEFDWNYEGAIGITVKHRCLDENGDVQFIETYKEDFGDGELVYIDMPMDSMTILDGTYLAGGSDGSYNDGYVDLDAGVIHFESWYDGERWRSETYTDCTE